MSHASRNPNPLAIRAPFVLSTLMLATAVNAGPTVTVAVDAREAPRRILHAKLTIPTAPGHLRLVYPKWIPGEHGPTGPITDIAGLAIEAAGRPIPWHRDPLEMYAFEVDVPDGASEIHVAVDFLLPTESGQFSAGPSSTERLVVLSWNTVVLYPDGLASDDITCAPSLQLPDGWSHGSALTDLRVAGSNVTFEPVTLTTLVDSPVIAGVHYRKIRLAPEVTPPHYLHIVADSQAALQLEEGHQKKLDRLVREALTLFGAPHYRSYHFLLTLSDHVSHFGLEHHESSDDRTRERTLVDDDLRKNFAGLLPHEMVHSWCGKYRRPAGLARTSYAEPIDSSLLWVYEGLTNYLGDVLTARTGLLDEKEMREMLAESGAWLDHRPGRGWRPLADTATAARLLYGAEDSWESWRRGVDFYEEGTLIWLEADVRIRQATGGKRSLDDFCRAFFGGSAGPPEVRPYTFDDLVAALGSTAPGDWRSFFDERLGRAEVSAPLGGLLMAGWKIEYDEHPNDSHALWEKRKKSLDLTFSIGAVLDEAGVLVDVLQGSPAALAGLGPGMKVIAIQDRRYGEDAVEDALEAARSATTPLRVIVENGEYVRTIEIDYHGGRRFAHLERDKARPDLLGKIMTAHARH